MTSESPFHFTFANLEQQFREVLASGYEVIRCLDYPKRKTEAFDRLLVNRVDVDFSIKKAARLREIFDRIGVKATFFIRLHAPEYNPFSFEAYRILRDIVASGHEVGLHAEPVDQAAIWDEDAEACLRRDLHVLESILGTPVVGAASHGGMTGLNNLDFWQQRRPAEFGLHYEGYDKEPSFNLFQEAVYVSDSSWTYWKSYDKGVLAPDDRRSLAEHARAGHKLIYLLIHSDTYFDRHFYE
jgi:peptidoglycan/xylan/chitin deacetylase (PgdA/CDA1 family)